MADDLDDYITPERPTTRHKFVPAEEYERLRAENARLKRFAIDVALQRLTDEMSEVQREDADYISAYNEIVALARDALK